MDHKQTNKPKKREWIDDYFLQLAAYALAHNETYGTNIRKGVVFMCVAPKETSPGVWNKPEYQEFVIEGSDFDTYTNKWYERLEQYYKQFL
jgi:genome maintenance exonuclease 1